MLTKKCIFVSREIFSYPD